MNDVVEHRGAPWTNWLGQFTRDDGLVWERRLGDGETNWLATDLLGTIGETYHLVGARGRYDGWIIGADGPPDHNAAAMDAATPVSKDVETVTVGGEPMSLGEDVTMVEKTVTSPTSHTPRSPSETAGSDGQPTSGTGDGPLPLLATGSFAVGAGLRTRRRVQCGDEPA